jgi:hypothetical protein
MDDKIVRGKTLADRDRDEEPGAPGAWGCVSLVTKNRLLVDITPVLRGRQAQGELCWPLRRVHPRSISRTSGSCLAKRT